MCEKNKRYLTGFSVGVVVVLVALSTSNFFQQSRQETQEQTVDDIMQPFRQIHTDAIQQQEKALPATPPVVTLKQAQSITMGMSFENVRQIITAEPTVASFNTLSYGNHVIYEWKTNSIPFGYLLVSTTDGVVSNISYSGLE